MATQDESTLPLLEFQKHMCLDLLSPAAPVLPSQSQQAPRGSDGKGDGLLICAKGLGLRNILLAFLHMYADPRALVILLNTPSREVDVLKEDLMTAAAAASLTEVDSTAEAVPVDDEETGVTQGEATGVPTIRPDLFRSIGNETQSAERSELYLAGGVLSVTSRILVVDMLNKVIPIGKILGIIVNHAHRVTDTSTESFILRLFRDDNKEGFIKALSDEPEAFTHGYWKLERSMKTLFLRHVFLWPRFHMTVMKSIEQGKVQLIEMKVKLTSGMMEIQAGLIECIDQCIAELRRSNPNIDSEELTVENAFFRSFDRVLRSQLDPIWHRVSQKTKILVNDLKILRRLLAYLVSYDCVTFNSFLETIVAANAPDAAAVFRAEASQSQWLLLDAAHLVLSAARQRVYHRTVGAPGIPTMGIPPGIEPVLEEQPKWSVFRNVMRDIERDRTERSLRGESPGPVLVMVEGDRCCNQLSEILAKCDLTFVKPEPTEGASSPSRRRPSSARGKGKGKKRATIDIDSDGDEEATQIDPPDRPASQAAPESNQMLRRLLQRYFRWKGSMSTVTRNLYSKQRSSTGNNTYSRGTSYANRGRGGNSNNTGGGQGRGGPPPAKRRRVRGGGNMGSGGDGERQAGVGESGLPVTFEQEAEQIAEFLSQVDTVLDPSRTHLDDPAGKGKAESPVTHSHPAHAPFTLISPSNLVTIRPYASTSLALAGSSVSNGDDDARVLEDLRPDYVVMYDADLGFVRRCETYQAQNPDTQLRVYFLIYENSVEEQRYLSHLRKEKQAFEKLIREKSIMAVPIDQDGRIARDPDDEFWRKVDGRIAGGQVVPAAERNQVVVDVREFRSSLPQLLHARNLVVRACTIEVGDYVLSPSICVERKSLSDLISSLKSGRLYTQCEAMSLHYKTPVLLIEFDRDKAFSLQSDRDVAKGEIDARDVGSRLCLLCLHFSKLRLIWSSSPAATAEIFEDLKKNQEEPKMEDAMAVGVDNPETIDSAYSITPSDILRSLPGITSKNYRHVMGRVNNLEELSQMTVDECSALVGKEFGRKLHAFFRKNPKDEAQNDE
ncbi:hypothetical protein HKX48_008294 [Thoreauomyces humboldtii]|nr:hypothetical protein HKX48_008294 [Thoreauomyces humboldtii]